MFGTNVHHKIRLGRAYKHQTHPCRPERCYLDSQSGTEPVWSRMYTVAKRTPIIKSIIRLPNQSDPTQNTLTHITPYRIIYLYSNKLHSIDIFYKQNIKIFVLSKTLKTSPTCFGHYLTIIREILYLS